MNLEKATPAVLRNRAAARARNTQVSLVQGWAKWTGWAGPHGIPELEPAPAAVERWLVEHLAGECGYGLRTIEVALWSLNATHREHGLPVPGEHPDIRLAIKGLRRRLGGAQQQAKPLTMALMARMHWPDTLLGHRDKALLLVGGAAGLRRSELAALDVGDVEPCADGLLVTVRRSKTDQDGQGQRVLLMRAERMPQLCPVAALEAWLEAAGHTSGALFRSVRGRRAVRRLWPSTVDRIVKQHAKAAGLGPGYSAHSLRAGMATWLDACGVSVPVIARHGRWASYNTVLRYCRGDLAAAMRGAY